jgi:hypothetical protein
MSAPSKFRPELSRRIESFMAKGFSLTAFAGSIKVSRETVYQWDRTIKEFSDALAIARARRTLYWERRLMKARGDSRAVIFALRNACSDEWKQEPEVSVTLNNDVKVDTSRPVEQWGKAELRAELMRRNALPKLPVLNGTKWN